MGNSFIFQVFFPPYSVETKYKDIYEINFMDMERNT